MAERTAEGGVLLRLQLDRDGKPFVQQVDAAMAGANAAVTKGARRAGASFGELLGSGFILKAAAATVVLRRLSSSAGDASPEFRELRREVSEAGKAIGTDLQYAVGSLLSVTKPFLDWIERASGGMKGLVTGTVLASMTMGPFKAALVALRIPGAQATAILLGLGAALGALAGKAAGEAQRVQREISGLVDNVLRQGEDVARSSREATQAELDLELKLLEDRKRKLADLSKSGPRVEVVGIGDADIVTQQQAIALNTAISESEKNVSRLKQTLQAYDEAFRLFARQGLTLSDTDLSVGDFISRQQLEIKAGEKSLAAARDAVRARRDEVEADLAILRDAVRIQTGGSEVADLFTRLAGGDATKGLELQKSAAADVLEQKRLIGQVEKDNNLLLGAQLDLTDRISEASDRMRTTELNRKVLQAQLVDALRGFGPVLEKQVLEEERRKLAIDEGGRAKTRILELDNQILGLSQQITQVEARREELAKSEADARWREQVTQFQTAYLDNLNLELALSRLAAESDQQFRRQRIQSLSEELGLRSLTVRALQDELAAINASAAISPELAAQRRQQLADLIGLLGEERAATAETGQEVQLLTDGFRNLANQGSLAMVQLFTRGKSQVKDFADFALQTFEQMFAQLLSRQVVLAFISLLSGGGRGLALGAGGSVLPLPFDYGSAGATSLPRLGPRPGLPSLPATGGYGLGGGAVEAKLDRMAAALENLKLQVSPIRLRGSDLHGSVQITEAKTAKLK